MHLHITRNTTETWTAYSNCHQRVNSRHLNSTKRYILTQPVTFNVSYWQASVPMKLWLWTKQNFPKRHTSMWTFVSINPYLMSTDPHLRLEVTHLWTSWFNQEKRSRDPETTFPAAHDKTDVRRQGDWGHGEEMWRAILAQPWQRTNPQHSVCWVAFKTAPEPHTGLKWPGQQLRFVDGNTKTCTKQVLEWHNHLEKVYWTGAAAKVFEKNACH